MAHAEEAYRAKVPAGAETSFHQYERYVVLQILDAHWREHLAALDHLRQGIHLRGYAQKNPKQEYKREAFELFGAMVEAVKLEVTKTLTAIEIRTQNDVPKPDDQSHVENVQLQHARPTAAARTTTSPAMSRPRSRRRRKRRWCATRSRPQRSLPLRLGKEVQALPRQAELMQ